ncbi:MAG: penicillin-binding protein activator [Hyphomonadaceae bacterium]
MLEIGSSSGSRAQPGWKPFAALALAAALAACASTPSAPRPAPVPPGFAQQRTTKPGLTPPFLANRPLARVGLLLPFAGVPAEAQSFYEAAELALFEANDPNLLLLPSDSGGDANGGANAAQTEIKNGADVIVGPLLRDGVAGAAGPARAAQTPIIAFSTDTAVAGSGVYLLSFPLEEEIARTMAYAAAHGVSRLAILAPEGEYGRRVDAAVRREAAGRGGAVVAAQFYQRGEREAGAAAQLLANAARAGGAQAILIAETGAPLRSIGPALFQAGVNPQQVRLLGVGWAGADAHREPTLAGAWYAAPDPAARAAFDQSYRAAYGRAPTRLASLAYDAVTVAAGLTRELGGAGLTRAALERPEGFRGADGAFRFRSTGVAERALAILEVRAGGAVVIDAPKPFTTGAGS